MNKRSLGALIALNIALLAALIVTAVTPQHATAQRLMPAQYIMVAGDAPGRTDASAVYIVEITTGRVAAVIFRGGDKKLEFVGSSNILNDLGGGKQK